MDKLKYFEENSSCFFLYVNDELWGIVNNFDQVKEISLKIISEIQKEKPHYIINCINEDNTITINMTSPGHFINNYYKIILVMKKSLQLIAPFDIEIVSSNGEINVIKDIVVSPPSPPEMIPIFEYSNVFLHSNLKK